jgi:hypothetical protein
VGRRSGPTVAVAVSTPADGQRRASAGGVVPTGRFLDLFLGLVAGTGTRSRADCGADHGAWRASHDRAQRGAGRAAPEGAGPGPGLVVTFGRFARHRTGHGTDATTDDRADRATDRHADGRAAERAGAGPDGLLAVLFVLGRGAVGLRIDWLARAVECIVVEHVPLVDVAGVVLVHVGLLVAGSPVKTPGRRRPTTSMAQPY